jgi:Fic family protein
MELTTIIKKMDALMEQLDKLRPIPEDRINKLNQKLRLDWNYHSNSIEGNTLSASETRAFILHGITAKGKPFRDYVEMCGHNEALKKLESIVQHDLIITENLIKEYHKIILAEPFDGEAEINPGEYKKEPNYLYSVTGERIDFASPSDVPRLMNELVNWLNNHIDPPKRKKRKYDLHPLVIAAGFHVQFIKIHPFGDGNGRMARILMNLILMLCGYVPAIVRLEQRENYYSALNLSSLDDLEPFAEFLGEQCIQSLELAIRAAKGENIEEPDDLDKKVALLKQKIGVDPKEKIEKSKSKEVVLEVFENSIIPLIDLLEEKLNQFEALFMDRETGVSYDGYDHKMADFKEVIVFSQNSYLQGVDYPYIPSKIYLYSNFEKIRKVNSTKTISIKIIELIFESNAYSINVEGFEDGINKLYHQNLSKEEIERIVMYIGNDLLASIEEEMGNEYEQ